MPIIYASNFDDFAQLAIRVEGLQNQIEEIL